MDRCNELKWNVEMAGVTNLSHCSSLTLICLCQHITSFVLTRSLAFSERRDARNRNAHLSSRNRSLLITFGPLTHIFPQLWSGMLTTNCPTTMYGESSNKKVLPSCAVDTDSNDAVDRMLSHGGLDPLLNLPEAAAESPLRVRYVNQRKRPQIAWMANRVGELLSRTSSADASLRKRQRGRDSDNAVNTEGEYGSTNVPLIVDVGGGRGDLSLLLAAVYPHTKVLVIEPNKLSLDEGQRRAKQLRLHNIQFLNLKVQHARKRLLREMHSSATNCALRECVVVALHACGGLTDAALQLASSLSASFVVCACCYCSNWSLLSSQRPVSELDLSTKEQTEDAVKPEIDLEKSAASWTDDQWYDAATAAGRSPGVDVRVLQTYFGVPAREMLCLLRMAESDTLVDALPALSLPHADAPHQCTVTAPYETEPPLDGPSSADRSVMANQRARHIVNAARLRRLQLLGYKGCLSLRNFPSAYSPRNDVLMGDMSER